MVRVAGFLGKATVMQRISLTISLKRGVNQKERTAPLFSQEPLPGHRVSAAAQIAPPEITPDFTSYTMTVALSRCPTLIAC